jgi:hypothetical protein
MPRSRHRKKGELDDLRNENNLLRKDCRALSTRCDAMEEGMMEFKSLYEIERLKNRPE